ncbi:MAG TPA: uroporphyrinogen-III synthase [Bryobacteraceae bacterium]|nr:uroporphyrinogen-III synthase [Bryobacteraceae bacterium]
MRKLDGLRIVVTRATHQAEELAAPLRALGAEVILLPTIGIAPPADLSALRSAAANCNQYDWIIFTSANAIAAFMAELPFSASACKARVATVGAASREAAEQQGLRVAITPDKYVAEALVAALGGQELNARRILIPSAAVTRDVVAAELRKRGAQVEVVEAYRNVVPVEAANQARAVFQEPYPDWVTLASSSAAQNLIKLAGRAALSQVKIATIGPITSDTVRAHALHVAAEAGAHTISGLIEAVASFKTSP